MSSGQTWSETTGGTRRPPPRAVVIGHTVFGAIVTVMGAAHSIAVALKADAGELAGGTDRLLALLALGFAITASGLAMAETGWRGLRRGRFVEARAAALSVVTVMASAWVAFDSMRPVMLPLLAIADVVLLTLLMRPHGRHSAEIEPARSKIGA